MTLRRFTIAAAVLAIAFGAVASFWKRETPSRDVTIQFTAGVRGRLVPYGCFSGKMGGLTRIATLFRSRSAENVLRFDAGDAIEGPADFQRIGHLAILKAFAKLDYAATRQPVFETHRVLKSPGRIAVVGVVDLRGVGDAIGEGLVIEKMETTLGNLLPKLKAEADFIVLLAFTDEATMHALAREFYELDVILGGNVSQPAQRVERENRSVLLYTANQSCAVGTLAVQFAAPHRVKVREGEVLLVSDQIPKDQDIRQIADGYRAEIRRTNLDLDDPAKLQSDMIPGVKGGGEFAGTEVCLACHAEAARVWRASHHARAFATLVTHEADADPNCIGCHTVGFGTPGGYRREYGVEKLTNVGCESCHGAGARHVAQRAAGRADGAGFRTLGAGDCQKCHHGEFSRPFDFDKFWPLIRHGKEGASAR